MSDKQFWQNKQVGTSRLFATGCSHGNKIVYDDDNNNNNNNNIDNTNNFIQFMRLNTSHLETSKLEDVKKYYIYNIYIYISVDILRNFF